MGKSRISLNIHGQNVPDGAYLLDVLRKLNPVAVLVMDNLDLAKRIHATLPDTMTIYRHWGADSDDNDALQYSPEAWVKERAAKADGLPLWMYTTNEPEFNAHNIEWNTRVVELAAKQGLRVVVGNWGVGKPVDVDNAWNMADRLLRLLDAHRDTAVMGLHEYACGVITSGFIGGTPQERGLIMPDTWPEDTTQTGALWHCGRFRFMERYCKAQGIKPPRIILTEHGFDDVSDIKPWTETLKKTPVAGNPGGNIRGWKTLATQWGEWFGDWTPEQAYFEQLKYANEKLYKGSSVEAQLIFSWGHSSPIWYQFDIAEARELHNLLIGYASVVDTPPPAPLPDPPPPVVTEPPYTGGAIMATNRNTSVVIVRHIASKTNGKQVGVIPVQADYTYYPATSVEADGYTWVWIECGDVRGWSALEALAVDDLPPPEPPDDAPDSETQERILLELEHLKARVAALESRNDALETLLAGVGQLFVNVNGKES